MKNSRFTYSPVGTMSYRVTRKADGTVLGLLWRTTEGWSYRVEGIPSSRETSRSDEVIGLSRESSAGLLSSRYDRLVAEAIETPASSGYVVSYANEDGETIQREAANAADAIDIIDDVTPHLPAAYPSVSVFVVGDYDGEIGPITRDDLVVERTRAAERVVAAVKRHDEIIAEDAAVEVEPTEAEIREAKDAEVVARVERELLTGHSFDLCADSNRSADRMNYRHMVPAEAFGKVLAVLGNAARMGDYYAEAAMRATRKISPYLNDWQIVAGVADAFAELVRDGWTDTRSATGPEAGRPSSHEHPTTIRQAITLRLVLTEVEHQLQLGHVVGIGWVIERLIAQHEIRPYATYLPKVAAQIAEIAERAAKRDEAARDAAEAARVEAAEEADLERRSDAHEAALDAAEVGR